MRYRTLLIVFGILILALGLLVALSETSALNIVLLLERLFSASLNEQFWMVGLQHAGADLVLLSACMLQFTLAFKHTERVFVFSSLAIVMLFLIYVTKNIVNIPINDDYYLLQFLNSYVDSGNISEAFNQLHESRLILMKLLTVLLFHLNAFNFKILILIGVLCLLGISFLLFRSIQIERKNKLFLALILSILLFQFQYYDSTVWASGALYNTCTLLFAFASIYLLILKTRNGFFIAMACSVLCVTSCGIGFISFALGLIILASQKKLKESLLWGGISIGLFLLYFYNYSFGPNHYFHGFSSELSPERFFECFLFSFTFLGSSLQFLYQVYLPMILGIGIWAVAILATYKKYHLKNPAIYYLLLFILLSSLAPPLFRKNLELTEAISIRYGVYSILAISCCFIFLCDSLSEQSLKGSLLVSLPLVIVYHLLTGVFFYPEVVLRKEVLNGMISNYRKTNVASLPEGYESWVPKDAEILFNSCEQKNIYRLPEP